MLKKTIIALLALVVAVLLVAPATANAQVVVGVGVGPRRSTSLRLRRRSPVRGCSGALCGGGARICLSLRLFGAGSGWRTVVSKALCLRLPWISGSASVRMAAVSFALSCFVGPSVNRTEGLCRLGAKAERLAGVLLEMQSCARDEQSNKAEQRGKDHVKARSHIAARQGDQPSDIERSESAKNRYADVVAE